MTDVIICGSGPAGMSAALYLKRANLDILIIEKGTPGGKLISTALIENYPGYIENTGIDLAMIMYRQVKRFKIPYVFSEVVQIEKVENEHFIVHTKNGDYESKRVIWAAGTIAKSLDAEGEQEFIGRGISYCAICDGSFHENQNVVVIGGGNSALEEAIYLAKICKKVTIITRGHQFRADSVLLEKAKNSGKVDFITHHEVIKFEGENLLEQVTMRDKDTKELSVIKVKGAFIYIGFIPSSTILENFDVLNDEKYIVVDRNCETKIKGLYAAGDCIDKTIRQIATAVADGISCASAIIKRV
jgi:thioredoxin-disulfide reductase